jgi:UDP-N-acetylmuramoyl-L-alanyl-D-glutamate--2,6-diaminopimelate ligase
MEEIVSLRKIFLSFPFRHGIEDLPDLAITRITADSRKVIPGALFIACPGGNVDGHDFIESAIKKGAVAVVGEKANISVNVPYIQVENSRQSLAHLAAAFFDHPSRKMTMIGITGTDGKTTTSNLLYNILRTAGLKVGMISTVNAVIGDVSLDTGFHVTTPDAPEIQQYLSMMYSAGSTHVILETTSHGWAQFRVDACDFDIGVITNITHEHLDQHGSFEKYQASKARLFESLSCKQEKKNARIPRLAILNKDDSSYKFLLDRSKVSSISYGINEKADLMAENIFSNNNGVAFNINYFDNKKVGISSPLIGVFNVSNCLAAFSAAVVGLGIDPSIAANGIKDFNGVPGRMERIESSQEFTALVDFAHTPNALRVALQTARTMTKGKVIVIFGSAGLRDREKRKLMAETSAALADISIFTAEDPRTESLEDILSEMMKGVRSNQGEFMKEIYCVPDRGNAIRMGVKLAKANDVVMCCGKGHEQSMCFGTIEYAWDDRIAMLAAIAEHLGIEGPRMPYLPTQENKQ